MNYMANLEWRQFTNQVNGNRRKDFLLNVIRNLQEALRMAGVKYKRINFSNTRYKHLTGYCSYLKLLGRKNLIRED